MTLSFGQILDGLKGLADEYDDMRQQLASQQSKKLESKVKGRWTYAKASARCSINDSAVCYTHTDLDEDADEDATEDPVPSEHPKYDQIPPSRKISGTSAENGEKELEVEEDLPESDHSIEHQKQDLENHSIEHQKQDLEITLLSCWQSRQGSRLGQTQSFVSYDSGRATVTPVIDMAKHVTHRARRPLCIMSPSNSTRVFWDMLGMFLLGYDILVIPLGVFDLDRTLFLTSMDWVTLLFWTGDMAMSCTTSYVHEGKIIYSPRLIFVNYLKSWFLLDVAVNLPDWIAIFLEWAGQGEEGVMDTSVLRSLRVIRSVRLLRLVKLKRILAMIKDRIASEVVFIALNIIKLLTMLLLMNHLIACAWYAIGGARGSDNWRTVYEMKKEQAPLGMRYATSLHWALTQFTPANSGVEPQNSLERWFAIQILMIGLVSSSSFISSITGSMSQLRNLDADKSKQFWLLRRYLKQKQVPLELSFKVLRYTDFIISSKQDAIDEKRITILDSLSDELRNQLKFVISYSCLKSHVVFAQLATTHRATLFAMAGTVLSEKLLAIEDSLFSVIDESTHMYYLREGSLKYTQIRRITRFWNDEEDMVAKNATFATHSPRVADSSTGFTLDSEQYLCEIVLWAEWHHIGKAKALAETNIINIDAQAFCELMLKDQVITDWLCHYAREFVNYMLFANGDCIETANPELKMAPLGIMNSE